MGQRTLANGNCSFVSAHVRISVCLSVMLWHWNKVKLNDLFGPGPSHQLCTPFCNHSYVAKYRFPVTLQNQVNSVNWPQQRSLTAVQKGLTVICRNAWTELYVEDYIPTETGGGTECSSVRHYRLACHIYNSNTPVGTHAKCIVIGTPSKDHGKHCFVEVV